jgi:hypothetical protein
MGTGIMTDTLKIITVNDAFEDFLRVKGDGLTRRAHRNYREVLDLFAEFLDDRGLGSFSQGPSSAAHIEEILDLVDEFNDEYLVGTIQAERDFLRTAGLVTRDLSRWLRNRPIPGAASTPAVHP